MTERPIPFSAPMVRAILSDTKTQTRRVVKVEPPPGAQRVIRPFADERLQWAATDPHDMEQDQLVLGDAPRCPYGQPGDRLWVREAWKAHTTFDHLPPRDIPESHVWYMADDGYKAESRYRQGMFMPRWASRITLEVSGVRVERLQDISEADALAEGVTPLPGGDMWTAGGLYDGPLHAARPQWAYRRLWEQINGPESWAANPWVWVVEFKRLETAA